ncbi:site-specific integrase [Acinetobacter baumannii]|uniref:tyrosine-type recombinase/integrase n=1 Tax=Acinetobacter baumannii TaxID=470 RepID=UPI00293F822B|nr:tyrosine-type recombinase/integrase [Acinetobacter baumannii]MDV4247874.1 site-specific integrase [Acinetobacter baumannii]
MKNKKLYSMVSNLSLPNYLSTSKQDIKFFNIDALPFLIYPNGVPCYEANSYLIYKLKFGYSQKYNGGTYRIFANHLTHFIRFTFYCKKIENFSQFDNNLFSDFMDYLQDDPDVRSNNQIIRIAYQAINFLFFIAELYNLNNFIGIGKNNKISLSSKNKKVSRENNKLRSPPSYFHYSFPPPSPQRKRYPVSLDDYNKLLNHINYSLNEPLRLRNLCLIQALENTGGRRTEVCSLSMKSLRSALKSESASPLLEIINLKINRLTKTREIPVSRTFLLNLRFYVHYYRNPILQKKGINHDYIFISHTSGHPLQPDTLTTYMNNWSKEANLSSQVCAHMFRHRFITEKFKSLILEHELTNSDEFRKMLLNTYRLKQIMLEWTGHRSITSLDTYINLAFDELSEIDKLKEKILTTPSNHVINSHIKFLENSLNNNFPIDPIILRELLDQLKNKIK